MYVYNFRVPQRTSKYSIYHEGSQRRIIVGYHGLIYADRDGKMVMRIKLEAEHLPPDFPIQSVDLDLNYDLTKISGQEFLLPMKSELHSREGKVLEKVLKKLDIMREQMGDDRVYDVIDELLEDALDLAEIALIQRLVVGAHVVVAQVRQEHAQRREVSGQARHDHRRDVQLARDRPSVNRTGASRERS